MHLKRQKTPKTWPISRKSSVYVVRPNFSIQKGIPILIILRDILKIAQNRKEVKKALNLKQILLNNKPVIDEKNSILLFDVLTITSKEKSEYEPKSQPELKKQEKKHYKLDLSEKGKYQFKEIKESESNYKIAKIINKKILKGRKTQLNLSDGNNFLSEIKCNVNDSLLINLKDKKIERLLPLKEKVKALVFSGKHTGQKGTINKINQKNKTAELVSGNKKINILIKQLMVLE